MLTEPKSRLGKIKPLPNFGEYPSLLKNPFAPCSAPGSGAEYAVSVAFSPCFRALLDRRPGPHLLFQQAEPFHALRCIRARTVKQRSLGCPSGSSRAAMVCLRSRPGNIASRGGGGEDGALLRDYGPRPRRLPAAAYRWTRQDRARGHPPLGGGASAPQSGEEAGYW